MYRLGRADEAADLFWRGLAVLLRGAGLARVPDRLTKTSDLDRVWRNPDLLLAQTCGYPLVNALAGRVRVVATPVYRAAGCSGAYYRSALVVRRHDPRGELHAFGGAVAAINDHGSHSGCVLLRDAVAPHAGGRRFFADTIITGSHQASLAAVRGARADIAAIDCVSLALASEEGGCLGLRVLAWTRASPGLPLITAAATSDDELAILRAALVASLDDPSLAYARQAMLLDRFDFLPANAYDDIAVMQARLASLGA